MRKLDCSSILKNIFILSEVGGCLGILVSALNMRLDRRDFGDHDRENLSYFRQVIIMLCFNRAMWLKTRLARDGCGLRAKKWTPPVPPRPTSFRCLCNVSSYCYE